MDSRFRGNDGTQRAIFMAMTDEGVDFYTHQCKLHGLLELLEQVRHLNGGHGSVEAFVAKLGARPLHGLFEGFRRDEAVDNGDIVGESDLGDAVGRAVGNVFEVHGCAADHDAETDDGAVAPLVGEALDRDGDFKRAGHTHDVYCVVVNAMACQTVHRALDEAIDE